VPRAAQGAKADISARGTKRVNDIRQTTIPIAALLLPASCDCEDGIAVEKVFCLRQTISF
jgi:hypothetical protein